MRKNIIITLSLFVIVSPILSQDYLFNLEGVQKQHLRVRSVSSGGFGVPSYLLEPQEFNNGLIFFNKETKLNWKEYKYLVCDVWHDNLYSLTLFLEFFSGEHPEMTVKIGINPRLRTHMVFPLSYLDGQEIFLPRYPRQMKGTAMGHRIDPEDIKKVLLRIGPFDSTGYAPTVYLSQIRLSKELPQGWNSDGVYYVDELGQWQGKEWEGKTTGLAEMKNQLMKMERELKDESFQEDWNRFGGWKKKSFPATGFFRTHFDGKRWWLVDPEGYAFLSTGVDCINSSINTVYNGNEDLFSWIPGPESKTSEAVGKRNEFVMIDFLKSNLMRTYGDNWEQKWADITVKLLKSWGFNTIGNWSNIDFARKAGIPYVLPMSGFPGTPVLLYRDFPDVFDNTYREKATIFASQLELYKDDPYLIGYFLDNEPHWAFGENNLAFEMLRTVVPSATRNKLLDWLKEKYGNSAVKLNTAWNTSYKTINEVVQQPLKKIPSALAEKDLLEFSGLMVDEYIRVVCEEVKKVDPNHLNLGLRYAYISSELCYRAGAWFDVFSINGYSYPGPPPTEEIAKRSGKPVMIGEFHFGATDRGLPATGIVGARSQQDRARAYKYYVENGFARPELIGIHYFQWLDQSITGRFDGENYNIGFLDICYKPYDDLVKAAKESHSLLYRIAAGDSLPFKEVIPPVPAIYY